MSKALENRSKHKADPVEKRPRERVTSSDVVFATGKSEFDGLDLTTDPNPPKIIARTKEFMEQKNLQLPRDEERVAEHAFQLMHSDEFYGKYDPKIISLLKEREGAEKEYNAISEQYLALAGDEPVDSPKYIKLSNDYREASDKDLKAAEKFQEYYESRGKADADGVRKTESFDKNTLVCREYGFIASYVLHGVGIQNDLVSGYTTDMNGHQWVQSKLTGATLQSTRPEVGYEFALNNNRRIGNADVMFTYNTDNGEVAAHGFGKWGNDKKEDAQIVEENIRNAYKRFVDECPDYAASYAAPIKEGIKHNAINISDLEKRDIYSHIAKDTDLSDHKGFIPHDPASATPEELKAGDELKKAVNEIRDNWRSKDKDGNGYLNRAELPTQIYNNIKQSVEPEVPPR